jgi:protein-L-isoaspartate(D-aspartate) O-methyltransferase
LFIELNESLTLAAPNDYEQGARVIESADVFASTDVARAPSPHAATQHTLAAVIARVGIGPGMRVLEIGCDGGYSAALLAAVTGRAGHVVTVDHDRAMTERTSAYLQANGFSGRVTVLAGDGEHGAPEHAPFDAIIAMHGAWDIPAAWIAQLTDGGILVVPADSRGIPRSLAFRKADGHLVSISIGPSCRSSEPGGSPAGGSPAGGSPAGGIPAPDKVPGAGDEERAPRALTRHARHPIAGGTGRRGTAEPSRH